VAGVHGVGGFVGTVLIGVLATATVTGGPRGLLFGGGTGLLGRQALAAVTVAAYSFTVTWVIATVLKRTVGFRVATDEEHGGLDLAVHGETAYDLVPHAVGGTRTASPSPPGRVPATEPA
jgi:ammonium transporter, Amt family